MKEDCIFCKMAQGQVPIEKIYENNNFFSMPDNKPAVKGHSLVISKKHFENALELPVSLGSELLDCIKQTSVKILEQTKSDGFNVVNNNFKSAGQVVNHIHFHILPRKTNDGFKLDFCSVGK